MKRTELNIGDELFYATPGDWRRNTTTSFPGIRARVLATERYTTDLHNKPVKHPEGTGVLVEFLDETTGEPKPSRHDGRVVQLGHLRGPYAATLAEVKARRNADLHQLQVAESRRHAVQTAVKAAVDRARLGGWSSAASETRWNAIDLRDAKISLSLADFVRMLDTLDERT